jgi:hypothetical protein
VQIRHLILAFGLSALSDIAAIAQQSAADVAIGAPTAIVADGAGNIYFAVSRAYSPYKYVPVVLKLDRDGVLTRVAGTVDVAGQEQSGLFQDYPPGLGDGGPARSAPLTDPTALALDRDGNLYIADGAGGRIRKVTPDGAITTVAGGLGRYIYQEDNGDGGPAISAHFFYPYQLAVDVTGNLYVGEWNTPRVRKISAANGIITSVVGTGRNGYSGDGGPAASAQIGGPWGLAFDTAGNLYISDDILGDDYGPDGTHIRSVSPDQIITTIAGVGTLGNAGDGDGGSAMAARLDAAGPITVDNLGNIYFACESSIRRISPDGIITTIAGGANVGYSGDGGDSVNARVSWSPHGVGLGLATDGDGNLYIADTGNYRIRRISPDGIINTVAGNGKCCYTER